MIVLMADWGTVADPNDKRAGEALHIAAEVRARQWLEENKEAIESSNAYVEQHGLPLDCFRRF